MNKVLLGRTLYFDTALSGDGTVACVSCHSLDHGGAEPRKTSVGIKGQVGPINSPTVLNSSYNFVQFWDGRAKDLQEQAEGPVANPIEMGATWEGVVKKLSKDETYTAEFAEDLQRRRHQGQHHRRHRRVREVTHHAVALRRLSSR